LYTQSQHPETKQIEQILEQQHQEGSISVGVQFSKRWTSNEGSSSAQTLVVTLKSRELIDGQELLTLGQTTCSELEAREKQYDLVYVGNVASPLYPVPLPFVTFSYYIQASGSCDKWLRDSEFQQSISGLKDPRRELEDIQQRIRERGLN
jgi:hypothetical protein